ncbi:hypothetical protein [Amycolatopsis sp. EV170708-02-1]|nr:hypothetical protein [Amycolatopsis sp. EV170708-02-1]
MWLAGFVDEQPAETLFAQAFDDHLTRYLGPGTKEADIDGVET